MAITRVEAVAFGVLDLERCKAFLRNLGLPPDAEGAARFRTLTNQVVRIDKPNALPSLAWDAPNIAEIVWGVDSEDDLARIADALARDRDVDATPGGVKSRDETGYNIVFRRAAPADAAPEARRYNRFGKRERERGRLGAYGCAHPLWIMHVALDIPKDKHREAIAFYVERLGFKPVEDVAPTGVFLQCEGETEHHQLFLCHRTDRPGINHIALEARDFDEVIEGGNFLVGCGWKEARRLGRHTLGSNLFRFFQSPLGGRIELATDMDQVQKEAPTVHWAEPPPHHLWMIKTSGDAP